MNNHFEKYVKERQEETLTQYVESIELLFNYSEQNWQTQVQLIFQKDNSSSQKTTHYKQLL